jgi:hypothetical protein
MWIFAKSISRPLAGPRTRDSEFPRLTPWKRVSRGLFYVWNFTGLIGLKLSAVNMIDSAHRNQTFFGQPILVAELKVKGRHNGARQS